MRPASVTISTKGSSQYKPLEPLRIKLILIFLFCASCVIAAAIRSAPNDTALESQGT